MKEKKFIGLKKKNFFKVVNKKFFKNEKTTVCVIRAIILQENLPLFECIDYYRKLKRKFPNVQQYYVGPEIGSGYMVEIKTKSVCSENDTYDEKLGKNIADAKAEMKLFDIISRIYKYHASLANKVANDNIKGAEFMELCYQREMNFVYNL